MIKCPNCGSTAQVKMVNYEPYLWERELALYIDYKCGCGKCFTTRQIFERKEEEILDK